MTTFTEGTWPMYLTQSNSFLYPLVQPSYCSWTLSHLQKMLFLLSIFCFALCLYFEFLWWETMWHLSSCLCFISLYMFSRYIHFLPMTQVYHSLQQSNIPSCINLIFFFSIHLWMDIQSASMVQLLQTVIWQTWVCMDCWLLFPGVWIKVPLLRLLSSSVFSLLLLLTLHVFYDESWTRGLLRVCSLQNCCWLSLYHENGTVKNLNWQQKIHSLQLAYYLISEAKYSIKILKSHWAGLLIIRKRVAHFSGHSCLVRKSWLIRHR